MNQTLIDNALLVSAAVIALLITRFSKERKTGSISSFFLLFSPLIVFLNMWAHTIAVLIVHFKRYQAGSFQYSFHFYSLLLFGVVFIIASGINISLARKRLHGDTTTSATIHWLNLGTALLFLPTVLLNPIGLLPVLASLVSSAALKLIKPFTAKLIYGHDKKSLPKESRVA